MNGRELALVLAGGQDAVEAQPLAHEFVQGFLGAGMIEHAARGLFDALRRGEIAPRRRGEQLRIRHAVPESIGEPARGHIRLPLRIGGFVQAEEETGGLQHRLDHQLRALDEVLFACSTALRIAFARSAPAAGGRPSVRTRARNARAQAADGLHGISPRVSPPRNALRASRSAAAL